MTAGALLVLAAALGGREARCDEDRPHAPLPRIALEPVVKGLESPVDLVATPGRRGRLYVVEQEGRIVLVDGNVASATPFLDLTPLVRSGGEMGLLGLAIHPRWPRDPRCFVNYTSGEGGLHTVIAEYRVLPDGTRADPASARIILTYAQPWENHNGGDLAFGPDGMLYIGSGDGGAGDDPRNNAQNKGVLLGKMLRIDVDGTDPGLAYRIPRDNPFRGKAGCRPEIWAYGLRNPWRYAFDRVTGFLWVGDVGQNNWEEVDIVRKGLNYGWRIMEGTHCTPGVNPHCDTKGLEPPVLDYGRKDGACVIGGCVYRGTAFPPLDGVYLYGDYTNGRIWGLRYDYDHRRVGSRGLLLETGRPISSFGEDAAGEVYVCDHTGEILKVVAAP